MQHALESSTPTQGSVLYGTVNGAIGNIGNTCIYLKFEGKYIFSRWNQKSEQRGTLFQVANGFEFMHR